MLYIKASTNHLFLTHGSVYVCQLYSLSSSHLSSSSSQKLYLVPLWSAASIPALQIGSCTICLDSICVCVLLWIFVFHLSAQEPSSMLCDDLEGAGESKHREGIYVYIHLIQFVVQQKLTPHCQAIILQKKGRQKQIFRKVYTS